MELRHKIAMWKRGAIIVVRREGLKSVIIWLFGKETVFFSNEGSGGFVMCLYEGEEGLLCLVVETIRKTIRGFFFSKRRGFYLFIFFVFLPIFQWYFSLSFFFLFLVFFLTFLVCFYGLSYVFFGCLTLFSRLYLSRRTFLKWKIKLNIESLLYSFLFEWRSQILKILWLKIKIFPFFLELSRISSFPS